MILWELPGFHEVLNHEFGVQLVLFLFLFQLFLGSSLVVFDEISPIVVNWDSFGVMFNATVIVSGRVYSGMMVPVDVGGRVNVSVGCNCLSYYLRVIVYGYNGSSNYSLVIPAGSCMYVRGILVNDSSSSYVVLEKSGLAGYHESHLAGSRGLKPVSSPEKEEGGEWSMSQLVTLVVTAVLSAVISSLLTYIVIRKH